MRNIKEAVGDAVHFKARKEAGTLDYSLDPRHEAFPGEFYLMERIKGSVRGEEIDLKVIHGGAAMGDSITGKVGNRHAGYAPDMGMKIFNRYIPYLRKRNKIT